jgi:hypothetical protein
MAEESMSDFAIETYHCVCSTLILATPYDLSQLPIRKAPAKDQATICALGSDKPEETSPANEEHGTSTLHNTTFDRKPLIVRREDGFEKRLSLRCTRCNLVVGYTVDDESTSETSRVVFLLPGGLMKTEDMKKGKRPQQPAWAAQLT